MGGEGRRVRVCDKIRDSRCKVYVLMENFGEDAPLKTSE
jgi:hypothetical protein